MKAHKILFLILGITCLSTIYAGSTGGAIGGGFLGGFTGSIVGSAISNGSRRNSSPRYVEQQTVVERRPVYIKQTQPSQPQASSSTSSRREIHQLRQQLTENDRYISELEAENQQLKKELARIKIKK